jgi:hypothetical protein
MTPAEARRGFGTTGFAEAHLVDFRVDRLLGNHALLQVRQDCRIDLERILRHSPRDSPRKTDSRHLFAFHHARFLLRRQKEVASKIKRMFPFLFVNFIR